MTNTEFALSDQVLTAIIAEYFKTQPILRAWLFSSFARGEAMPESDVDILVEFDHSSPIGLFTYAQIWRELQERLGRDIASPLFIWETYTKKTLGRCLNK